MNDLSIPENQIAPIEERFPFCNVLGITNLQEFTEYCKANNLAPTQLTREETQQRITITHDPLEGKLHWEITPNMDGLMATLIAGEALFLMPSLVVGDAVASIAEYFTQGKGHIDLGTGEAFVAVGFKDGKLSIQFEPHDKPIALKKLLMAALLSVLASDAGMPMENIWKLFDR